MRNYFSFRAAHKAFSSRNSNDHVKTSALIPFNSFARSNLQKSHSINSLNSRFLLFPSPPIHKNDMKPNMTEMCRRLHELLNLNKRDDIVILWLRQPLSYKKLLSWSLITWNSMEENFCDQWKILGGNWSENVEENISFEIK